LFRGVNRFNSLPGRCNSTVRNRPTSDRTPGAVTASTDMTRRLPIVETRQAGSVAGLAFAE
jgi:hypothetical protein